MPWQIYLGRRADVRQAVVPALVFVGEQHGRGEEAINLYTAVFADSRIEGILRYDGSGDDPEGSIQHAQFQLCGETFMLMESALEHPFGFNESISFMVYCDSQEQIDHSWSALLAVPEAERCGWIKDRFGVSWQIVPAILPELLKDSGSEAGERVMGALMNMEKLDIGALRQAYEG